MEQSKPGPSTVACIDVDIKKVEYLIATLESIVTFFEARDEMNAAVHVAGIRFSPITLAAHELRTELSELRQQALADLKNG